MKCDGRWHRYRYVDENGVTRWPGYNVAPNPVIPWAETCRVLRLLKKPKQTP